MTTPPSQPGGPGPHQRGPHQPGQPGPQGPGPQQRGFPPHRPQQPGPQGQGFQQPGPNGPNGPGFHPNHPGFGHPGAMPGQGAGPGQGGQPPKKPVWKSPITWVAVVAVLAVIVFAGVQFVNWTQERDESTREKAEMYAISAPEMGAVGGLGSKGTVSDDPEWADATLKPPANGTCIRLDKEGRNLSREIRCDSSEPHFRVISSSWMDEPTRDECNFVYVFGRDGEEVQVCLYPMYVEGECYLNSQNPGMTTFDSDSEMEKEMNAGIDPVDCASPPDNPRDMVVQMLGESPDLEGLSCPPETEYVFSDPRESVTSCLGTAGA